MRFGLFFIMAMAQVGFSTASRAAESPGDISSLSADCQAFVSELPKDMFWGLVTVPESRTIKNSSNLSVFYYGRTSAEKKSVVFFNGGPAADSHDSFKALEAQRAIQTESEQIPFIFMDQRGTGCSSNYPTGTSLATIQRLLNYGSNDIVEDAEAVRRATIKSGNWIIYGASYGGNIVTRYIEKHPESIAAAFSFAGGVSFDLQDAKERFLSQQEGWKRFLNKYPEDGEKLSLLKTLIPANHCTSGDSFGHTIQLCGSTGLDVLSWGVGFQLWDFMDEAISQMIDENNQVHLEVVDQLVKTYALQFVFKSDLAETVISWKDSQNGETDVQQAEESRDSFKAEGTNVDLWPVSEIRMTIAAKDSATEALISTIPKSEASPINLSAVAANLRKFRGLQFFTYVGENDTFVPPGNVKRVATKLRAEGALVSVKIIPGAGHESSRVDDVLIDIRSVFSSSK